MRTIWMLMLLVAAPAVAAPNGVAALLTDYGADSIYVGVLKGAMLSKNSAVRIETVTNSVPNYDIVAGAYLLAEAAKQWPAGTAFCCVVDPGVGTRRKSIAVETNNGLYLVGPDNGLLSLAAKRFGVKSIHELSNTKYFGPNALSSTFQGRDIYGPVTAAIAGGAPLDDLGPKQESLVELDFPEARVEGDTIHGAIIRADGYGNLVTNIPAELMGQIGLEKGMDADVTIGKAHYTAPYRNTYADVPEGTRLLCAQSIGMVEAAINKGDLAGTLKEGLHAEVVLRKAAQTKAEEKSEGGLYFAQSGGIAGTNDELTLQPDGKCHLNSRRKGQRDFEIGKDKATEILALVKKAFDAPSPDPNAPKVGGADYMSYVVRYGGKEKKYNDLNAPEAFRDVTRALVEVVARTPSISVSNVSGGKGVLYMYRELSASVFPPAELELARDGVCKINSRLQGGTIAVGEGNAARLFELASNAFKQMPVPSQLAGDHVANYVLTFEGKKLQIHGEYPSEKFGELIRELDGIVDEFDHNSRSRISN